jgi:hypothetical protein
MQFFRLNLVSPAIETGVAVAAEAPEGARMRAYGVLAERYACSGGGVVVAGRIGVAAGKLATDTGAAAVGVIVAADATGGAAELDAPP